MVDRNHGFQVFANLIMILLALVCILPFVLLIASSLTNENALIHNGYSFWPSQFDTAAYKYLLIDSSSLARGYRISTLVTVMGTVASLTFTTLFAFPLSRKELPGRSFFSFFLFFTMLFNGGLVPTYIMWTQTFHIKNTLWALMVPNLLLGAFNVIMMRTYFQGLPYELEESATIDGASNMCVLYRIILPLSAPIIAVIGLYYGVGHWNSWYNAMIYLRDRTLYPIQLILREILIMGSYDSLEETAANTTWSAVQETLQYATIMVATVPILCVYPFLQKYFDKGVLVGALKG
jgi:putative aldouronate transport system permease protein